MKVSAKKIDIQLEIDEKYVDKFINSINELSSGSAQIIMDE